MYLKELLFIILIITIGINIQCYTTNQTVIGYKTNRDDDLPSGLINEKYSNNSKSKQTILGIENSSNAAEYKTKSLMRRSVNNIDGNNKNSYQSTVESIADLYFFSSPDVMGIRNCSYENTVEINFTKDAFLTNGSYIYDKETLIPPQLLGNFDYEILYNGTRRKVPLHTRACICHLKPCITLCNTDILDTYEYVIKNEVYDAIDLFFIDMTQANKSVVKKNIAAEFEPIVLTEYCESYYMLSPEASENSKWTLFENGSLLRHSDQALLKRTEYCFDMHEATIDNETYDLINPKLCSKKKEGLTPLEKINYCVQVLSIIFLLLTIIAYCSLPKLLNVHGKCFLTYLCCLTVSFGIFSFINLSQQSLDTVPCFLMAYLNHYLQLSHYTWLGIICYDTWKTLSDYRYISSYRKYAKLGYPLPSLMTVFAAVAQNINIHESLKPGISTHRCGLDVHKWAAAIYLYGPCLIVLVSCLISFILTSRLINTNDREVTELRKAAIASHKTRYALYFRLFLMMGLSWFFDVLSYLFNLIGLKISSVILDYINAMQGFYIFSHFILRREVRNMIKIKIRRIKRSRELNNVTL